MSEPLESKVGRAVEEDEDVRERVREAVEEEASAEPESRSFSLTELSQRTVDAAIEAIDRAAPKDPESTLRKVVDGLGDGLERSAQATRLAVEEAASEGRAYAQEDLRRVADDFRTLGEMFVGAVDHALRSASQRTGRQWDNVRDHVKRTYDGIRPSITDAARAAAEHPVGLAGESAGAAVKGAREVAGSLFNAVGGLLQRAGDTLGTEKDSARKGDTRDGGDEGAKKPSGE